VTFVITKICLHLVYHDELQNFLIALVLLVLISVEWSSVCSAVSYAVNPA